MMESKHVAEPSTETLHLAYAEAGVVLLETLMQLLIDRKVLDADDVIQSIETAIATKRVLAEEGNHAEISNVAAGVLSSIANSIAAGRARVEQAD
jgi:hypothetical protein